MAAYIKNHLIKAGVKNLREYGYPEVNEQNILTDEVYKAFFESMLEDNKGARADVDKVIDELLLELKNK